LANWKFNFQKTHVIGSLRYLDESMNRFVSGPFFVRINRGQFFYNETGKGSPLADNQSLFFEEATFLNHIIENWDFDITQLSKHEQEDYLLAVEKLKTWKHVQKFMHDVRAYIIEIKRLIHMRRFGGDPQHFYIYNFPEYEWSVVARYHAILLQLEPYPEWTEKFINEVEPHLKQLADHSPMPLSQMPMDIFFGIDLHKYFR